MKYHKDHKGDLYKLIEIPDACLTNGEFMIDALEQIFEDYINLIDREEALELTMKAFNKVYKRRI